jgi:hypothetical protein
MRIQVQLLLLHPHQRKPHTANSVHIHRMNSLRGRVLARIEDFVTVPPPQMALRLH